MIIVENGFHHGTIDCCCADICRIAISQRSGSHAAFYRQHGKYCSFGKLVFQDYNNVSLCRYCRGMGITDGDVVLCLQRRSGTESHESSVHQDEVRISCSADS